MSNAKNRIELCKLIIESLEGSISAERFALLDSILANNPEAVEYYNYFLDIHTHLKKSGDVFSEKFSISLDPEFDIDMWQALAASEKTAVTVEVERAKEPELKYVVKRRQVKRQRVISKLNLYTAIVSSAALIFLLLLTWVVPVEGPIVATLTDSIDAVWEGASEIAVETEFHVGRIKLTRGFAELMMYDGAVVTLQAPAEIELEGSNRLLLLVGKLSAVVPENAVGFVVRTPGVSIVDYGTEFGVTVDSRGDVETHVFKGEVEMRLGSDPLVFNVAKRITQGQALQKTADGNIESARFVGNKFVRKISSKGNFTWDGQNVNLADIIGSGNGFGTGKANWGIDIRTGKHTKIARTGDAFINVSYQFSPNPFIDGVFIPDASNGPVRISSTGLNFVDCPDTNGTGIGGIFNGAWHNHILDKPAHLLRLDGRTFEKSGEAFFIHANKGITFDLDAIRHKTPGVRINKFTALAGVSDTVLEIWSESSRTDFWVLVDGQVKLKQVDVKPEDISFIIDIPLTDQDRFLTIITTDSGDEHGGTNRDWALFASPVLELELE